MKKICVFGSAVVMMVMTAACSDDSKNMDGDGRLSIKAAISSTVDKVEKSRAADDTDADYQENLAEQCNIWVSRKKDNAVVRKFVGTGSLPTEGVTLNAGDYKVEAWSGDSVTASWTRRFFKGESDVTVAAGQDASATVICRVANVLASVNYSNVDEALTEYSMTIYPEALESRLEEGGKSLTFGATESRKGYFMMPKAGRTLKWVLSGTAKDGSEYIKEGRIADAQAATEYVLNVKFTSSENAQQGAAAISVTVIEQPVETVEEKPIILRTAPEIGLYVSDGGDGHAGVATLDDPFYVEKGSVGPIKVFINSSATIKNVYISNDQLDELFPGIGGKHVDLMEMSEGIKQEMKNGGLFEVISTIDTENHTSQYKINFDEAFTNRLEEGEYSFEIEAVDADTITNYNEKTGIIETVKREKRSSATLTLVVSDATVMADPIATETPGLDFNETEAVITATVLKEGVNEAGFYWGTSESALDNYVKGESIASRSIAQGTKYRARLTGLQPGVKYYYVAASDMEKSSRVESFETPNRQLPNSGFEDFKDGKPLLLYTGSETNMFWDSGNHGSATMKKNVTDTDESIKHSGNRSLRMSSQFVGVGSIGKFAAGNAFIGKYLKTDGTDGELGWGRKFSGRPKQLKGWVKYSPVAITDVAGNAPAEYKKGDMDRGIIYVALLDDSKAQGASEYQDFPVVVKTKSTKLFDKNGSDVIAYGEMVFEGNVGENGMVEFTINLDYKRSGVIPTYILLTMSASKGGDYFTGGSGSKMWVDDLELVY
ncbi:MAG: DUF4493 domain-containing protein [Muribaculaceae bacterium]|nr:DUF4493 domain-containing protein [Muribaculaceae bacterium]